MSGLPRMARPCPTCPWRRDSEPGTFGIDRFRDLASTCAAQDGASAPFGAPLFACHNTPEDAHRACAGWLAVEGAGNVTVRLAVSMGRLPGEALSPGGDWPELWESFTEMVEHVAGPPGVCRIAPPDSRGKVRT